MTAPDLGRGVDPTALPARPRSMRPLSTGGVAAVAVVVVLLTAGALAGLLWWVGTNGLSGNELALARLDAVKVGLSIAVGSGGGFALFLAWRRQRSNEADHEQRERVFEHQRLVADEANRDALERRITELYTKAADQLGSDKAPVRLAGIYALERLAQDNADHRQTIVNVLCAYLRMPYAVGQDATEGEQERQVRLTAQRVLAGHLRPGQWPGMSLDLEGATLLDFDLSGCEVRAASFDGARFVGPASCVGMQVAQDLSFRRSQFDEAARFSGVEVAGRSIFTGAWFQRDADFVQAAFETYAAFNDTRFAELAAFDGTRFGGRSDFALASFGRTSYFRRASFGGLASFDDAQFAATAVFDDARFTSGVGFAGARFQESAVFGDTEFADEASFNGTAFEGDALFGGSVFHGQADFSYALFGKGANFRDARFARPAHLHAYVRRDVKGDQLRCWPPSWVLHEPPPGEGQLGDREGSWSELFDKGEQ